MKFFSPYTDLALETAELLKENNKQAVDGVVISTKRTKPSDTTVTTVEITDSQGAADMGRPIGSYITIESPAIKENDISAHEELIRLLSDELRSVTDISDDKPILVIGLGNSRVTPDSLGPRVVDRVLVTRHIRDSLPDDIRSVRSVAAVAPGVMGVTGIETLEIVQGITEKVQPQLIIAVDALAARKVSRINSTIQLCNTGVAPGAGVGNKRATLDKSTLGVPVIAIGVPTVVDAATLANDTITKLLTSMLYSYDELHPFYSSLVELKDEDRYKLICDILDPYNENMFVTPKEVDETIDNLVNIIANAINIALQPDINKEDISRYK
jgi:spore protease